MTRRPILKNTPPVDPTRAAGGQKHVLERQRRKWVSFHVREHGQRTGRAGHLPARLRSVPVSESGFTPPEQEVVFLAASRANGCDYCTAAHSMIADMKSKVSKETLRAIRPGSEIPDARLAALYRLTTEMVRTHGLPSDRVVQEFLAAGFEERQLLYVVLALAVKTLSNFSNLAMATELDERFAAYRVAPAKAASA